MITHDPFTVCHKDELHHRIEKNVCIEGYRFFMLNKKKKEELGVSIIYCFKLHKILILHKPSKVLVCVSFSLQWNNGI